MPRYNVIANINIEWFIDADNKEDAELQACEKELPHGYVEDSFEMVKVLEVNERDKCLYCPNTLDENPHFQSYCCKRGMCEECFGALVGTDQQLQLDGYDPDDQQSEAFTEQYAKAVEAGYNYLCFDHLGVAHA